jgi:DNA-binding MarR family transcriptional regulator
MQELQERSLFTPSGMTRLVDRMERDGFVGRENVPGDRRGVLVVLTAKGARAYDEALAQHRADIEREFGSRLTAPQHKAVARALDQFWHD